MAANQKFQFQPFYENKLNFFFLEFYLRSKSIRFHENLHRIFSKFLFWWIFQNNKIFFVDFSNKIFLRMFLSSNEKKKVDFFSFANSSYILNVYSVRLVYAPYLASRCIRNVTKLIRT